MQKLTTVIFFIFFLANQIGLAQEQRKLQPAKSQNQPRLGIVADPGDENWFAMSGMNNLINALAVDGSGNLYAGGFFTAAGGTSANYVAKWDGNSWSALGNGMNSFVYALAFDSSGNLYAGGLFTTAGGVSANRIAKWDGNSWSALGSGVIGILGSGFVYALAFDGGGNLYVGGEFNMAGGKDTNNIAKWDGSNWSALGTGTNNDILALADDSNGNLYAGGSFTSAGGNSANYIAKWDGNSWSALGSGTGDWVYALAVDGSANLYAGGSFTSAGGDSSIAGIAKWNSTSWSALGSGINNWVETLVFDGSANLYAGGLFTAAGGNSAKNIAKWDGNNWSALGSGVDNEVLAFADDGSGNLYTGGKFTTAGGKSSDYIALWVDQGAVPVELTSFSATVVANSIKLEWNTATETNNFGFDVERSADGSEFNKIGFVAGLGTTTTPHNYQFVDKDVAVGTNYYRLKQMDLDGAFEYSHVIEAAVAGPKKFYVAQNYPNPFNPSTTINYSVERAGKVELRIYDLLGRKVRNLVQESKPAGEHSALWNGKDDAGRLVAGGSYFYELRVGEFVSTKRMLLLK